VKDRLWAWGSLGKTDVRILTIRQTPDKTILKNGALKVTGQVTRPCARTSRGSTATS